jgi:hypothetical protein
MHIVKPDAPKRRKAPERYVQAAIVKLLRALGAHVYVLGTTRKRGDHPGTMQTPGIPDLIVFMPGRNGAPLDKRSVHLYIEVKAPGGKPSLPQKMFATLCTDADVVHLLGGVDDVIAWLIDNSYMRPDQVACHHTEGRR